MPECVIATERKNEMESDHICDHICDNICDRGWGRQNRGFGNQNTTFNGEGGQCNTSPASSASDTPAECIWHRLPASTGYFLRSRFTASFPPTRDRVNHHALLQCVGYDGHGDGFLCSFTFFGRVNDFVEFLIFREFYRNQRIYTKSGT